MNTHHHAYTAEQIEHIAQQLQAITVNNHPVFTVIVSKATLGHYHAIYLDTKVGTQTLEFRKAEETPTSSAMQGQCDYPGCYEQASIECCMIGCNHKVCETHGNCAYEETPDHSVPICWYCCGKGWGE